MADATCSPLYNAELAPPELRGFIISMQHLNTNIGLMCAYWISVRPKDGVVICLITPCQPRFPLAHDSQSRD